MYYSSKEAEIYRILFDTCDDKIRPLLFLQSPFEQIWSVSLKIQTSEEVATSTSLDCLGSDHS